MWIACSMPSYKTSQLPTSSILREGKRRMQAQIPNDQRIHTENELMLQPSFPPGKPSERERKKGKQEGSEGGANFPDCFSSVSVMK